MNSTSNNLSVRIAALSSILGLCGLLGCSKATPPVPAMSVNVATVGTNAVGEVLVQLNLTNRSARGVVVSARSAIYAAQGTWITNFNIHPLFVGLAGPGSQASDVSLLAGQGITAALAPVQVSGPFQIEWVCFPSRAGIAGTVDKAQDKIVDSKDGSQHKSYLGESFYVVSPSIDPRPEPDGAANRSQPVPPRTNRTPPAAGSGG